MAMLRIFACVVCVCAFTSAQAATLHVEQAHPDAADINDGSAGKPFKTVNHAAALAEPGDTVVIGAGVYREHVWPVRGGTAPDKIITYQARAGERVVIKGSELWQPTWAPAQVEGVTAPVWRTKLDPALFSYDFPIENFNPFVQSPLRIYSQTVEDYYAPVRPTEPGKPLAITRGAIFLDGKPLKQITDPKMFDYTSGVFLVAADGEHVLARLPLDRAPQGVEFEIVVREQCFAPRDLRIPFIHLKGLSFEHAANGNGVPQMGMVSTSRGRHWIFEDCSFRWAGTCGLDVGDMAWYHPPGRGDDKDFSAGELDFTIIVQRCTISDNGTVGLWCYGGGRSLLVEDCVVERNNRLGRLTWEEAGIKCHGVQDCVFRNNLIRDNDSYGLWLDGSWGNNRITQNLFIGNMNCGVMLESIAVTTVVDNNIIAYTRPFTFYTMTQADGVYTHGSSNMILAHNLVFGNIGFGLRGVLLSGGNCQPYPESVARVSNNRLLNNIVYANGRGAISLPMKQRLSSDNVSSGNLIWGATDAPQFDLSRGVLEPARLVSLIEAVLKEQGISAHQAPMLDLWKAGKLGPEVGDMRHNGPLVGLPVWQAVLGLDTDSVVGALPKFHVYRDGRIVMQLDPMSGFPTPERRAGLDEMEPHGSKPEFYAKLGDVKCQRLDFAKHDYFGHVRPDDAPVAVGPIHDLQQLAGGEGETVIELWPNASAQRPPGRDMQIKIKPKPFRSVKEEGKWVE